MLKVEGLVKQFGERPVLQGLSFSLKPGEIYGLLGPNGAGKTTTINIICQLLNADQGQVSLGNQPVSGATKAWLGIAPQENLLYRSLTCAENLDFFGRIYGLDLKKRQHQIKTCLAAVNLQDRADSVVETLSGGMQRRLSIAVALVHNPKVVILDEPTTGLDIEARYEIWSLIQTLQAKGITVLLTTHLLEEAERLCNRIGILKNGRVVAEGSMPELRRYVPAAEIVTLQTPAPQLAIAKGEAHGFTYRQYGTDLAFWVPKALELKQLLACFEGVKVDGIARQPVRLEHIYLEVTQNQ